MPKILLAFISLFLVATDRPVRRAKPPEFNTTDFSLFMDNAFDSLKGERPVFGTKSTVLHVQSKAVNRPNGEGLDRSEMMERLLAAESLIAEYLSNAKLFKSNVPKIEEESAVIVEIGEQLFSGDPDYCMEDGYLKRAQDMKTAAVQMRHLTQKGNYEAAARALSRVKKSCDACHNEFRL